MQDGQSLAVNPTHAPSVLAAPPGAVLELCLHIADPEVITELEKHTAGPDRERFALSALRLGVLVKALKSAGTQA